MFSHLSWQMKMYCAITSLGSLISGLYFYSVPNSHPGLVAVSILAFTVSSIYLPRFYVGLDTNKIVFTTFFGKKTLRFSEVTSIGIMVGYGENFIFGVPGLIITVKHSGTKVDNILFVGQKDADFLLFEFLMLVRKSNNTVTFGLSIDRFVTRKLNQNPQWASKHV
jgi:hypothetical protein